MKRKLKSLINTFIDGIYSHLEFNAYLLNNAKLFIIKCFEMFKTIIIKCFEIFKTIIIKRFEIFKTIEGRTLYTKCFNSVPNFSLFFVKFIQYHAKISFDYSLSIFFDFGNYCAVKIGLMIYQLFTFKSLFSALSWLFSALSWLYDSLFGHSIVLKMIIFFLTPIFTPLYKWYLIFKWKFIWYLPWAKLRYSLLFSYLKAKWLNYLTTHISYVAFYILAPSKMFIACNFFLFFFAFFCFVFWVTKLRILTYFLLLLALLGGFYMLCIYNSSILWYQFILKIYALKMLQISYVIGVDNISIYFVILCVFLVTICYLMYWFLTYNIYLYSLCLIITLFLLINIFIVLDFFLLFIFFEGIIIPMMLLINFWGSRFRKIHASNLLVLFTLYGSIFMLISFLSIYSSKGSSSFFYFWHVFLFNDKQLLLWLFLFIGFAVKIPVIPLHIWLPEAHVEAPTPGSVILAGVLLKLGTYAMARLLLSFINVVIDDVLCFIWILACLGFNLASIIALNQQDMKKIIAYSSIAHINFSLFGFFGDNILGLSGMFFFMLGHAITSSALFIGIGVLYDRYKTRYLFYYGALALLMPIFSSMYFITILSNFAFPGTFNFVGEILIISSIFKNSNFILVLSIFPMILSLIYSFFFFSRVFFGTLSAWFIRYYCDCIRLEFVIFSFFVFLVLLFGINPMLLKTILFF